MLNIDQYPIYFFVYHGFQDTGVPNHFKHLYKPRKFDSFVDDISFLESEMLPISMEQILRHEYDSNKKYFHICFDDGHKEVFDTAMPFLEQKHIPASVFINPPYIANHDMMYRYKISILLETIAAQKTDFLLATLENVMGQDPLKKILNLTQLDELRIDHLANILDVSFSDYLSENPIYGTFTDLTIWQQKGFHIGAHSMNHPHFHLINREKQLAEINDSVDYVMEHFPSEYRTFAFPFHDYNLSEVELIELINETQLDACFGSIQNINPDIPKHYPRIQMDNYGHSAKKVLKNMRMKSFTRKYFRFSLF